MVWLQYLTQQWSENYYFRISILHDVLGNPSYSMEVHVYSTSFHSETQNNIS
jgi:hypothetical protein